MNTDYLRYFVAVAEELHFRRAAERLFMAQQPLSRQVQRLEAECGVKLFERTTRRVALTAAGEAFLEEVRRTLAALDRAVKTARRAANEEVGTLRLGYTATALYNVLPEAVRAFREQYPEVQLELTEMSSAGLERALLAKDIQAALLYGPVADAAVESVLLLEEPLVVALPERHRPHQAGEAFTRAAGLVLAAQLCIDAGSAVGTTASGVDAFDAF